MTDYIMPQTGEVVPEPDEISDDGGWIWKGEAGTPFPMTGEIGGDWEIHYCPMISGNPKLDNWWTRFKRTCLLMQQE